MVRDVASLSPVSNYALIKIESGADPGGRPGVPGPPPLLRQKKKKKRGERERKEKKNKRGKRKRDIKKLRCHNLFFCVYIGLH